MARIDESGTYDLPIKGSKSNADYLTALQQLKGALVTNIAEWGSPNAENAAWLSERNQQLVVVNSAIATYTDLVAADTAAAAAATALLNANANLTPEQLTQLQLNAQNTAAAAAAAAAKAKSESEAEKSKQNFAAASTKYYIIAAVVIVIIIGVIVIFVRSNKKAAAAPIAMAA